MFKERLPREIEYIILEYLPFLTLRSVFLVKKDVSILNEVFRSYPSREIVNYLLLQYIPAQSFLNYLANQGLLSDLLQNSNDAVEWRDVLKLLIIKDPKHLPHIVPHLVKCIVSHPEIACKLIAHLYKIGILSQIIRFSLPSFNIDPWEILLYMLTTIEPRKIFSYSQLDRLVDLALESVIRSTAKDNDFILMLQDSIKATQLMCTNEIDCLLKMLTSDRKFFINLNTLQLNSKNLTKMNFRGLNLLYARFENVNFIESDGSLSNWSRARISRTNASCASFFQSIMRGFCATQTNLTGCNFQAADMRGFSLLSPHHTELQFCAMTDANFTKTEIDYLSITGFKLYEGKVSAQEFITPFFPILAADTNSVTQFNLYAIFILNYWIGQLKVNITPKKQIILNDLNELVDLVRQDSKQSFSEIFAVWKKKFDPMLFVNPPKLSRFSLNRYQYFNPTAPLENEARFAAADDLPAILYHLSRFAKASNLTVLEQTERSPIKSNQ